MRITRLRLENVKRHADLTLDFGPGLNVVRGPNEAGKTTIQRALEMALFRRANSTAQELDGVRRWGADAEPRVTLTFEEDGSPLELTKRFAGQKGTVELRSGKELLTDPAAVEQVMTAATGLPTEKFFRATASVRHQEMDDLDQDASTLRDRLQQSMSGADKGTYAARRKLEDAIRRYRSEGAKNPGYLKVTRAEVERLEAEVARGEAALQQLEADRSALTAARDARVALDTRQAELRRGVEYSQRAVTLHRRGADAQRRYNLYRRAAELQSEIERLDSSHPSKISLVSLRGAVERLRNVEYRLSEMRAELSSEPDLSAYDVAIPDVRWRPWALAGLLASAAALLVVGLGLMAGVGTPIVLVAAVLAATGMLTAYVGIRQRRLLTDIKLQNELRDTEIRRRLRGRSQLVDDVKEVERERAESLQALDLPDVGEAERLLAAESEHVAQIENLKAEYRGLFERDPGPDVVRLRDEAAAEADECRHALAGMGKVGEEPDKSLAAYEAALKAITTERERAVREEAQAEARVEANKVDAEQVALATESLAAAQERARQVERRLRVYETTLATLDAAEKATMKAAARYLEQTMAKDVERITGGRYRQLRVDEENLAFSVFSPELNDWVDARSLSQGTLDQLYLCARIGIVRQVTAPGSPPLIFDDPFVTFDDERAKRALHLLRDLATDHQIILLTTSERYDELAETVIVLPAPETPPERAPVAGSPQPAAAKPAATATGRPAAAASQGQPAGRQAPMSELFSQQELEKR